MVPLSFSWTSRAVVASSTGAPSTFSKAAASAAKHGLRLHREVLVEGRLVLWTFQKAP